MEARQLASLQNLDKSPEGPGNFPNYTGTVHRPTILVVEDEPIIAGSIAARLRKEGFRAEIVNDGPEAVEVTKSLRPDLVILDVMLPGFDGFEVTRRIQKDRSVPILMLTARDTETDMLVGLGIGADDYMTKPFSPRELVARVQAILRRVQRSSTPAGEPVSVEDLEVDPRSHEVKLKGNAVHVTPLEFDLLYFLASRPGDVCSREQLLVEVWGYRDPSGGARTIDSHIGALRKKVGADLIRTVHGVGYALRNSAH